jgi:Arc/MetJ-type ribon-helix-helix transcriptional regulator
MMGYYIGVVLVSLIRRYNMGQASRKINFLIDKDVAQEMENLVPSGKRSKVVNAALRKELELIKRKSAISRLLCESAKGEKLSTSAIVAGLSSDREGH